MRHLSIHYHVLTFLVLCPSHIFSADFNYEVKERVNDHIVNYFSIATDTSLTLSNFRTNGGFDNNLKAHDRDSYLKLAHGFQIPSLYYGSEDGSLTGYSSTNGYYREPGNDGYDINDGSMKKYLKSCINNDDGTKEDCLLESGAIYVSCVNDCELEPCPDDESQMDCLAYENNSDQEECQVTRKYCKKYTINVTRDEDVGKLGYIPQTDYCFDVRGRFTQDLGVVVKNSVPMTFDLGAAISPRNDSTSFHTLGNCYHYDGVTLVQRDIQGDYAYCGENGEICNNTFSGGFADWQYDARFRPWYILARKKQRPVWTQPYIYSEGTIGMTHAHPFYDIDNGRKIFAGVLAIDYRLDDIVSFLVKSYGETSTAVLIYEEQEPHFVIGTSTGSPVVKLGVSQDADEPCTYFWSCDPLRIKAEDISGNMYDTILVLSMKKHVEEKYPEALLSVKYSTKEADGVYLSQSSIYQDINSNITWRIIVVSPGETSNTDTIQMGNPLFGAVMAIGFIGVFTCAAFFVMFYRKRKEREVMNADWRFTCAFIFGCGLFNFTAFTLLGPNTDATCMLRMWSFNLLLVVALSPLFVKIWRIQILVDAAFSFEDRTVTNKVAALYTMPMIIIQAIALMLISIFDPPKQVELTENESGIIVQHLVCGVNTPALLIWVVLYEGGLAVVGCVLAYRSRNLSSQYGESKQLIFAIYNGAVVLGVLFLLNFVMDATPNQSKIALAVSILWATGFGTAAFVVPRLLSIRKKEVVQSTGNATTNNSAGS